MLWGLYRPMVCALSRRFKDIAVALAIDLSLRFRLGIDFDQELGSRSALLRDPTGALFAVLQPKS